MNFKSKLPLLLAGAGLFFGLHNSALAQVATPCDYVRPHQADNWTFGEKSLIDFTTGNPVPQAMPGAINLPNGVSSISDENGQLLFFTDGIRIWTSGFYFMADAQDLMGNNFSSQSSIIVPQPGNPDKYYVFTLDMYIPPVFTKGVRYSVVERINFSWTITAKNELLHNANAQKITSVKDADGNFWVVTHGFGDTDGNKFFAYKIDGNGLNINPVITVDGTIHTGAENNDGGYMKASPDGKKIALVIPEIGIIEVFRFDIATGMVSREETCAAGTYNYPFGLEFSPDNSKLYVSTSPLGDNINYLYQFDLNTANYLDNPYIVHQFAVNQMAGADSLMGAVQLGVDGKIYLAKFRKGVISKPTVGVIYNPNRAGVACNYNNLNHIANNGLSLNGAGSLIGMPNFVTSFLDIPHFSWQNHCHTKITYFDLRNEANIDQILWEFNDAASTSDQLQAAYTFSAPGTYTVNVTETFNGLNYTNSRDITIFPLPSIDIGQGVDTIYLLPNSSIRLDAGEFDQYVWEPSGTTGRYFDVTEEGQVKVTVTDLNCCTNADSVYIAFASIYLPNAFSPNSAVQQNRTFKVMGATSALAKYNMYVYNRWGQLMFESKDPMKGWDGKAGGELAPAGSYVWVVTYESFASGLQEARKVTNRGVVNLLR
ncbi:MAG: gliding motility-associated C-terminal domain-containing protein [Bacteroidales bacterium]|nr:gliding motility-associated C-terminal domain-containing protein [Bacteroidales bacterium]